MYRIVKNYISNIIFAVGLFVLLAFALDYSTPSLHRVIPFMQLSSRIAQAATTDVLYLSPFTQSAAIGSTFTVDIILNTKGQQASGVDVNSLRFNPAVLQVVDADSSIVNGVQIMPKNIFTINVVNSVDNTLGRIYFSQVLGIGVDPNNNTKLIPLPPYNGVGTLATVTFRVIAAGTSNATFDFTLGSTIDSNVASVAGGDLISSVGNGIYTGLSTVVNSNDLDGDGVMNSLDRCPNTPVGKDVNDVGCPRPVVATNFTTTDLKNLDLSAVTSWEIYNSLGKIKYLPLSGSRKYNLLRGNSELNIDNNNLAITKGKINLISANLPELNHPAEITLYGLTVSSPYIKKDGVLCTTCTIISYTNGTLVFSVTGFSEYEVIETPIVGGGGGGGGRNPSTPVIPIAPTPDLGCVGNNPFSATTGKACVNNSRVIPGCNNGKIGFSAQTGESCANNSNFAVTSTSTSTYAYDLGTTTLRRGSFGENVKELQRLLNQILNLGLVIDGKLGSKTIAVIKTWQKNNGLVIDGLVGPRTKAAMKMEAER